MLYSHNQEVEKLNLFINFLDKAVKGDKKYAPVLNDVLLETHRYATGRKTLYDVNRDLLYLIVYLATLNKLFFKELDFDPKKYNKRAYSKVLELVKEDTTLPDSDKEPHTLQKRA